jgi:hypothetical protein
VTLPGLELRPPADDEMEVSLFGPGYGECVLVHLGYNRWMIVDSCVESGSKSPLVLAYLQALGVNIESDVTLIVATHWHDDHVRGISILCELARNAEFVFSASIRTDELLALTNRRRPTSRFTSGVSELARVVALCRNEDGGTRSLRPVVAGTRLYEHGGVATEVWALSPSNEDVLNGYRHVSSSISNVINSEGAARVAALEPNDTSVVIAIESRSGSVLLGADLEHQSVRNRGWHAVMDLHAVPKSRSAVFKIPHHGSVNADCPEVWEHRLVDNVQAILAPFGRSHPPLPRPTDVSRIRRLTSEGYRTTAGAKQLARRDRATSKTIREATGYFGPADFAPGQLQLRASESSGWRVAGSTEARRL